MPRPYEMVSGPLTVYTAPLTRPPQSPPPLNLAPPPPPSQARLAAGPCWVQRRTEHLGGRTVHRVHRDR